MQTDRKLAELLDAPRRLEADEAGAFVPRAEFEKLQEKVDGIDDAVNSRQKNGKKRRRRRAQSATSTCSDPQAFSARTNAAMGACCPAVTNGGAPPAPGGL